MREAVALFIMFIGFNIPWSNGFLFTISLFLTLPAMLFLCLALGERLFIGKKMGYRMDIERPPLPPIDDLNAPEDQKDTPRNDNIKY